MNGIRKRSNRKPEREASLRKLRIQKPLSDCSNTVAVAATTAASAQSSTASTVKRQNPTLSSVAKTLIASLSTKNDAVAESPRGSDPSTPQVSSSVEGTSDYELSEPSSVRNRRQTALKRKSTGKENDVPFLCPRTPKTRNVGKRTKQDGDNIELEMDKTPIASTPPCVSSSTSDTINRDVYEPHSVYSRRQTAQKRDSEGQKNVGSSSCPPALKIRNKWDNSNEVGQNCPSKKCKAPSKTKVLPAKKETSQYTSPELEKQRAYFAELDKYELPVEEAEEWELD
ncbi:uncharacterized protein LOC126802316 isoform X2 [Argentina anserina]|uniref:uncharacterized protein LOC126802316 isoform X2 n=1 Tax=Argentina anserina TaxID=57926 RepID=UPI0021763E35|nr:uncharacterized protein LOC126802316 isoform X2 [Potentilla anserina]